MPPVGGSMSCWKKNSDLSPASSCSWVKVLPEACLGDHLPPLFLVLQLGSRRLNSQLNRLKGLGFSLGDGFLAAVFVVLIVWTEVVEVIAFSLEIVVRLVVD